jgi:hypothetical protein
MSSVKGLRARSLALLATLSLASLTIIQPARAQDLISRYESGERAFKEYESGNLLVYYHQRMIDDAVVEKDYIVYQFDKVTGELLAIKSHWRDDLPDRLPADVMAQTQAEAMVEGKVLYSRLYIISPESDVFPLDPTPRNPCWVVRHIIDGHLAITIVDAVERRILGNGVPPPYTGFALSGPWYFAPCDGSWTAWRENARTWFETMGYPTESIEWPTQNEIRGHIQSGQTAMFYELAHGSHNRFEGGCITGTSPEVTSATEIKAWIADYAKMPFAFIGSCGGLCYKYAGTFAYEFRKGEPESTTVVGYCGMSEPQCDLCWGQSIDWQSALFYYMSLGLPVKQAFDFAKIDYPECGDNSCMRFAGDQDFAVVPVVKRDPWVPQVTVIQPNGGEVLEHDTVYEITWVVTDNAIIDSVAILLSTDGGVSFPDTVATGEPNDSSFFWTVPDTSSATARIRVIGIDGGMNEGMDGSDADFILWGSISGIGKTDIVGVPADVVLVITGGNPIGLGAEIVFGLPSSSYVRLDLYDVTGRRVAALVEADLPDGYHAVHWSGKTDSGENISPGIYFLRLDSKWGSRTAKAVIAGYQSR